MMNSGLGSTPFAAVGSLKNVTAADADEHRDDE